MRIYRWCLNKARRILGAISFIIPSVHEFPAKPRKMGKFRRGFVTALFAILAGAIIFSPTCYSSAFGPNDYTWSGGAAPVWVPDGGVNFRLKFISSGTFTPKKPIIIDLFLLGGGAGGYNRVDTSGASGGGSGYAGMWTNVSLSAGVGYPVVVGNGGGPNANGNASSFNATHSQNGGALGAAWYTGGNGGSGAGAGGASSSAAGGNGGSNGSNGGGSPPRTGGNGQGTPTYEFGDASLTLYAGAGAGGAAIGGVAGTGGPGGGANGGAANSNGSSAAANTGGGGGGAGGSSTAKSGGSGGSGICVIRNHR